MEEKTIALENTVAAFLLTFALILINLQRNAFTLNASIKDKRDVTVDNNCNYHAYFIHNRVGYPSPSPPQCQGMSFIPVTSFEPAEMIQTNQAFPLDQ